MAPAWPGRWLGWIWGRTQGGCDHRPPPRGLHSWGRARPDPGFGLRPEGTVRHPRTVRDIRSGRCCTSPWNGTSRPTSGPTPTASSSARGRSVPWSGRACSRTSTADAFTAASLASAAPGAAPSISWRFPVGPGVCAGHARPSARRSSPSGSSSTTWLGGQVLATWFRAPARRDRRALRSAGGLRRTPPDLSCSKALRGLIERERRLHGLMAKARGRRFARCSPRRRASRVGCLGSSPRSRPSDRTAPTSIPYGVRIRLDPPRPPFDGPRSGLTPHCTCCSGTPSSRERP